MFHVLESNGGVSFTVMSAKRPLWSTGISNLLKMSMILIHHLCKIMQDGIFFFMPYHLACQH